MENLGPEAEPLMISIVLRLGQSINFTKYFMWVL